MSLNQTALRALAYEGIWVTEAELLNAIPALSESRSAARHGPTRPPVRPYRPSGYTQAPEVHTGWLAAALCVVGVSVALIISWAMAPAENTGNGDTGTYRAGINQER